MLTNNEAVLMHACFGKNSTINSRMNYYWFPNITAFNIAAIGISYLQDNVKEATAS
ncbi:hypothetical protein K450DRAFT_263785 [Umbelopsis ramanniana AG]|uniref:Uncharacterized protein n=1 Tax=Umbelopsis ramanniana AG TaxID=1314678 RepID=A0AAD5DZ92_UMBRA|nr:uncharacterized protein K450DRAFT_263785 [Umbelopsis ramanniana AG]KAI8575001.1 hypothetical protein K450DRAFT_263785 [Umbelopsis ramanniana AG]